MQRVISDGRAAHPGEVAVLLVVSCYTVRNRFQCLVGHLNQVQVLPLHFTFPVRQWQSTTFVVVAWQLVTELALMLRGKTTLKYWKKPSFLYFWHSLNLWFLTGDNFEILKFWNVFQRAFPHCFLCVQYTSLRKKTFTLIFFTWRYEDVTNVNARVCSLVYYLYALFGKNTMATLCYYLYYISHLWNA